MNHLISFYVEVLKSANLLLYPTDTIWGIGCDATSTTAIQKILLLKKRPSLKSMIILVNNIDMIQQYTDFDLSPIHERMLYEKIPTTFIIPFAKNLPDNLIGNDKTIAFRIPNHSLCIDLISNLGKPIISTSANISGDPSPTSFATINLEILKGISAFADPIFDTSKSTTPSAIIKINEDYSEVKIR